MLLISFKVMKVIKLGKWDFIDFNSVSLVSEIEMDIYEVWNYLTNFVQELSQIYSKVWKNLHISYPIGGIEENDFGFFTISILDGFILLAHIYISCYRKRIEIKFDIIHSNLVHDEKTIIYHIISRIINSLRRKYKMKITELKFSYTKTLKS